MYKNAPKLEQFKASVTAVNKVKERIIWQVKSEAAMVKE